MPSLQEYMDFTKSIAQGGNYRGGNELHRTSQPRLCVCGTERRAVRRAFCGTKALGGYYLIEAGDFDEAVELPPEFLPSGEVGRDSPIVLMTCHRLCRSGSPSAPGSEYKKPGTKPGSILLLVETLSLFFSHIAGDHPVLDVDDAVCVFSDVVLSWVTSTIVFPSACKRSINAMISLPV